MNGTGTSFALRLGATGLFLAGDGRRAACVERAARFASEAEAERRADEMRSAGQAFVMPWTVVPIGAEGEAGR